MSPSSMTQPLGITDVILRDAHQSLLATRMRLEDMLPMAAKLDEVGFWSVESWGGATFDACIRYLGEDPWERIRALKAAMPKTPQQMLLRGQNILGYRHYADDVVTTFVERAAVNGIDVFRIFDAMNDVRNMAKAIEVAVATGKHAQGTISYTVSPVHTLEMWVDLAKQLEDLGAHSICIKDMAGLLKPYVAFDLVSRLKAALSIPVHMQCHATTGMSTATYLKAIEAGIDNVDTAISSMSMTYGHSATESLVAILQDEARDTGLNLILLEEIAAYFREVRKKYAQFEGSLRGVDSRILVAQVPGGMLTNLENQLREQGAADRLDEVLLEIPIVREELGYIPLVTPTSQIVGTQAVLNVLSGERYKNMTKETAGVLRGEYGATPAPVDAALQAQVLADGDEPITCRPADLLAPETSKLQSELSALSDEYQFELAAQSIDDVMIYALFPQVGLKFLRYRGQPEHFEAPPQSDQQSASPSAPAPHARLEAPAATKGKAAATKGKAAATKGKAAAALERAGANKEATPSASSSSRSSSGTTPAGKWINAELAGRVVFVILEPGSEVAAGQAVIVVESMKMETEIAAPASGTLADVAVTVDQQIEIGDPLFSIA